MDLELKLNPDNILLIRTNDNVDYIGRVGEEEDGKITVERCLHVFAQEGRDEATRGTFQVGFMPPVHPALGEVDENARGCADLEFYTSSLKFTNEPNEQLMKMYKEASSGIAIPQIMAGKI